MRITKRMIAVLTAMCVTGYGIALADMVESKSIRLPSVQIFEEMQEQEGIEVTEAPQRSIDIRVQYENSEPELGDEIILTAELAGYKEGTYKIRWQNSVDGSDWNDVSGANDKKYTFVLSEENNNYFWRVTIDDIAE